MKKEATSNNARSSENKVVFFAVQLLVLGIVLLKCYHIIEPFLNVLLWGFILSVALFPLHKKLSNKLKGRKIVAAVLLTITMLLLVIVPSVWILLASVEEVKEIRNAIHVDELQLPAPNESVKQWPIIGEKIYSAWTEASIEKSSFILKHKDELKPIALKIISLLSSAGKGILMFIGAIIISGLMLVYSESINKFTQALFTKVAGNQGNDMNATIYTTIQNVAKGILGVAFLQSTLVGIGLILAGVPFAGLWAVICLLLAIIQVGILPVSLGVIIYIWGSADTTTAVLLTIWIVFLSVIDNILKPILMGKGAPAPMLVVFIGTIGGFIANGFIGLFTGAIILSIFYNLLMKWLELTTREKVPEPALEGELLVENINT
jgi:predicted PurR-regulated permease PerM